MDLNAAMDLSCPLLDKEKPAPPMIEPPHLMLKPEPASLIRHLKPDRLFISPDGDICGSGTGIIPPRTHKHPYRELNPDEVILHLLQHQYRVISAGGGRQAL